MERSLYLPKIHQAFILLLLYTCIFSLIPLVGLMFLAQELGFPHHDPLIQIGANISGLVLLLIWLKRKNTLGLTELFSPGKFYIHYLLPMSSIIIGASILISELDNRLRTLFPISDSLSSSFTSLFEGHFGLWKSILLVVIVAPIIEELIFRGLVLRGFLHHYSTAKAIVISAFLFGFIHLNIYQFFGAFIWGMIAGWWFVKMKSLIPCMIGHALNNSLAFIMINLFKVDIPGFSTDYTTVQYQPLWFNLIGIILLIVGIYTLQKMMKSSFV